MFNRALRRLCLALALAACLPLVTTGTAEAQSGQRCFAETGYCISGRIRQFWEQNGGLTVFGYPITPQQQETIEGKALQVQWFERNRLELHPENARPYDVLLGRLGGKAGQDATEEPREGCRFFAETGQNVCGNVLGAWRASGLELDGRRGKTEGESLALFGLPLTGLRSERLSDGREYQVQWFERARFELHPQNPPPANVLLGLLGREAGPIAQAPPQPVAKQPAAATTPARLVIEAINLNQRVVPAGVDRSGAPIVLDHDIAWFNQSGRPGQGENIVFWGHVLRFRSAPNIPAPFANLKNLKVGARITLYDSDGTPFTYAVTRQVWVTPDKVEYILPKGREMITMVSCIGDQVIAGGEVVDMSNRLITIAEPAE
ncbi:MAG TPA: class F sortase [Roseiflexaceae bacterium]|nr:class F sortase [Roseiflexaceae bacterium]